jgi:AraC-like DNA-binding protein
MIPFTFPRNGDNEPDQLSQIWNNMTLIPHAWKGPQNQSPLTVKDRILGDYEIIMVTDGKVKITMTNSERILKAGEYIIIPPYLKHSLDSLPHEPFVNYWIHFDIIPVYAQNTFNRIWDCEKGVIYPVPPSFINLLDYSFSHVQKDLPGVNILIESLLTLLLFSGESRKNIESRESLIPMEILDCCLDYIRKEYSHPLSLDEICSQCGVGRTALFSHFKKQLNCTPGEFIQTVRLQAAERLLKSSNLTIEQIAEQTGFTSPPSLYRSFKQRFGRSPALYREEFRG